MGPLVSVLMTAYNREQYIAEAIESVLSSDFRDFELIIVDDCSSDDTVSIAKKYQSKDRRIKVFQNEKNLGDYHNRNKAACYATGKYLKYVDSDDLIYSHGLGVMVHQMEKFPEAVMGIISLKNQEQIPYPFLLTPQESYYHHFFLNGIFDVGPLGIIYSHQVFKQMGGFSGKRYVGDLELNLRLAALWPMIKLPGSLVFWRQHDQQEYKIEQGITGYLLSRLPVYIAALKDKQCPLSQKQVSNILGYLRQQESRQLLKIALAKKRPLTAYKVYRELSLSVKDIFKGIFFPNNKIKNE